MKIQTPKFKPADLEWLAVTGFSIALTVALMAATDTLVTAAFEPDPSEPPKTTIGSGTR